MNISIIQITNYLGYRYRQWKIKIIKTWHYITARAIATQIWVAPLISLTHSYLPKFG